MHKTGFLLFTTLTLLSAETKVETLSTYSRETVAKSVEMASQARDKAIRELEESRLKVERERANLALKNDTDIEPEDKIETTAKKESPTPSTIIVTSPPPVVIKITKESLEVANVMASVKTTETITTTTTTINTKSAKETKEDYEKMRVLKALSELDEDAQAEEMATKETKEEEATTEDAKEEEGVVETLSDTASSAEIADERHAETITTTDEAEIVAEKQAETITTDESEANSSYPTELLKVEK